MNIQTKIIFNQRKWILNIPSIIMKGLGWQDDVINIKVIPKENILKIQNISKSPITNFEFIENIKSSKYEKNKKKFLRALNENLSPDGRRILFDTKWEEVEDGGYFYVTNYLSLAKHFKKVHKKPKNFKIQEIERGLSNLYLRYAKEMKKYLEDKQAKKPDWFKRTENELKKFKI